MINMRHQKSKGNDSTGNDHNNEESTVNALVDIAGVEVPPHEKGSKNQIQIQN